MLQISCRLLSPDGFAAQLPGYRYWHIRRKVSILNFFDFFVLFIVLTVVFAIGLFVSDMMDDDLGRKGLWCGFISQFILAVVIYSEINRQKKGQDKQSKDK